VEPSKRVEGALRTLIKRPKVVHPKICVVSKGEGCRLRVPKN
jgi:hypothetical protein